ncbi:MAG: DUF2306 domain-containing protein [Bacteroidia bacterium]|nr:DUF2306 domain-containing protein [Bacteroidia bacterium]
MKKIAWIIFGSLCVFFSFYPVPYFFADEPILLWLSKSAELLSSHFYKLSFFAHIGFGGIALLVGWLQFSKKLRNKYKKLHRNIGKLYVASVLISGPFGLYIAFYASGGLSPQLGFSIGAVLWTIITFMSFLKIKKAKVEAHRQLMIYSYAGTFGAVTLRLWLPILILIYGNFIEAYQIVAWLSWLPNMLVAYLIIHKKEELISFYHRFHIKRVMIGLLAFGGLSAMISCMSPQTWFYKKPAYKGTAFEYAKTLDKSTFSQEKLDEIDTYLKKEAETTSMLVLEDGKVVYEYGDVSEISYLASCRKSILAMLYGKHVKNGTIDLQKTIGELGLDEDDGLLDIEKEARVDHLITARSGVFHLPANGGYDTDNVKTRGSVKAGEYYLYNNWDFNAAGYILEQQTGKSVYEELEEQLAIPLGFQDWNIRNQKRTVNEKKSRYSAYHMHLSTRDMAKIGQLMLQEGNWEGKQLIPKAWIKKITQTVTPADTVSARYRRDPSSPLQESYGYMWWLFERMYDNPDFEGAYTASGFGGQYITVIPKKKIVIAHKTTLDFLGYAGISERSSTPSWRYWWILRNLMLNRKSIASLAEEKSSDEIISFIREEYQGDSEYAISERLINEYGLQLTEDGKCEDAIKFFELNLELYIQGFYTHRSLDYYGSCLEKLGRTKEAIAAYEKSLTFHPNNKVTEQALIRLKAVGI